MLSSSVLVHLRNTIHSVDTHSRAVSTSLSNTDKHQTSYYTQPAIETAAVVLT